MTEVTNEQGDIIATIPESGIRVQEAWTAVMREVSSLAKGDRNTHQNFNFRGIDAVMNAVGPALRKYGVTVFPMKVEQNMRDVQTTQGKASRECTVLVTYVVLGPSGDSFVGMAPGESMDSGDKATPKAMSVAFRTFLLQSLCLPTDETDPDAESHDRASGPTDQERAQDTADRLAKSEDVEALKKVQGWIDTNRLADVNVKIGDWTGPLGRAIAAKIKKLEPESTADADAAAEAALKESLGAEEIKEGAK